jgi:hypothetical protein
MDTTTSTTTASSPLGLPPFHIRTRPLPAPHHPAHDAAFFAAAFDACVPHCVGLGSGGMWGDRPFTERDPHLCRRAGRVGRGVGGGLASRAAVGGDDSDGVAGGDARKRAGCAEGKGDDGEEAAGQEGEEEKPAATKVFIAGRHVRAVDPGLDPALDDEDEKHDDNGSRESEVIVGVTTAANPFYRGVSSSSSSSSSSSTAGSRRWYLQLGAAAVHPGWFPGYVASQAQFQDVVASFRRGSKATANAPPAETAPVPWAYVEVTVSDVRAPEAMPKGVCAAILTGEDGVRVWARASGAKTLFVDAWSGNDGRLVR